MDIEHDTMYEQIPREIAHYFQELYRESHEGDYLIVTSQTASNTGKKDILLAQLKQLELDKYTQVFVHKTEKDKKDKDETKETVYINIKFPDHILNMMGDSLGIDTTLSYSFTSLFVKAPYKKNLPYCFNAFDADEQLEAMVEYLKKEIDFEYYVASGIIESHFMLHKGERIKHI